MSFDIDGAAIDNKHNTFNNNWFTIVTSVTIYRK